MSHAHTGGARRPGSALLAERPPRIGRDVESRPRPLHVRPDGWRAGPTEWAGFATVALVAIAADQLTKAAVVRGIDLGDSVDLAPRVSLWHVRNEGIAFGVFSGRLEVVAILTALAVGWMVVYFSRSGARHPLVPVALGLLLGGSLSNLFDRVAHGYVTDFVNLSWWPTFNFADVFIVTGVALLLWVLFRGDAPHEPAIDLTNR